MEEKKPVETILKEDVERLLETLDKTEKTSEIEEEGVDIPKVKEFIASLEGCSAHTVVTTLATAMLLLPVGAVMVVLDMGKSTLKARALGMFARLIDDCKGCPKDTEASEE
jgi:hypothetical protein